MSKERINKYSLKEISNSGELIFLLFSRLLIFVTVLVAMNLLYRSINNDQYVLQPFQVPASFEANGNNGVVITRKIQDKVRYIKKFVSSKKKDAKQIEKDVRPDLEIGIMGLGLSFNTLTYHMKSLLGRENKSITGELTDLDEKMTLSVRMTGFEPSTFEFVYQDDRNIALDYLIEEVAKKILQQTDPYLLGIYYTYMQEYTKSLQVFVNMIAEGKEEKWAYMGWANLLSIQRKPIQSGEKLKRALEIDPDFMLPRQALPLNYHALKEYEQSEEAYMDLLTLDPTNSKGWDGLAKLYRAQKKTKQAISAHDKAIQHEPKVLKWYKNKAEYLFYDLKDTIGAATLFQTIGQNFKDGEDKFYALSSFYQMMNKQDSFQLYTDQLLEINPQNDIALFQVIFFYWQKKDFAKALKYTENVRSIQLGKRSNQTYTKQYALNYLAMCQYQEGNVEAALKLTKEAINIDPNIAFIYTTLAETYSLMGQTDQFYKALEIAGQKGYDLSLLLKEEVYQSYIHQAKFKALIKKYEKPKDTDSTLVKN